jgi:hypothetical protein
MLYYNQQKGKRPNKGGNPMKITITAHMLCDLCGGKFTLEACEALCDWFDDVCDDDSFAPAIGDICVSYVEIDADSIDEDDEEHIIARLDNGNVLLIR